MHVKIEVDERTADALQARASELGVTVSELVAELATLDSDAIVAAPDDIAELDRRWNKIAAGARVIPHDHVVRWLRTWGTNPKLLNLRDLQPASFYSGFARRFSRRSGVAVLGSRSQAARKPQDSFQICASVISRSARRCPDWWSH
jgi:hypothetical protein